MHSPCPLTAATRIVFMIGSPIAQARSPTLFNGWFAERGMDCAMVPLDVSPAALPGFMAAVRDAGNCLGLVATLPHKQALLALVDTRSPTAEALSSVNVVRRNPDGSLHGDMTDGDGFWNGAAGAGCHPAGRAVALAGAGAAATAIAHAFAARGGKRLAVWSPDKAELGTLADRLRRFDVKMEQGFPETLEGFDMAINATPLAMVHAPGSAFSRRQLETMRAGAFAADAVTKPLDTEFLREAREAGLMTIDGNAMTYGQFARLRQVLGLERRAD